MTNVVQVETTTVSASTSNVHSLVLFFFSSRRRHTRFDCDWSSDVCSSDLDLAEEVLTRRPSASYVFVVKHSEPSELLARVVRSLPSGPYSVVVKDFPVG